jgi:hypothetical protein
MGREARCVCRWGDRTGNVTALLESTELSVRGELRGRDALADIEHVGASADTLELVAGGERIALVVGAAARRWAQAIAAPPDLARKLGITASTVLHVAGQVDDAGLAAALARTAWTAPVPSAADLAVVRADDTALLAAAVAALEAGARVPPVWLVYAKGRDAPLGESAIRGFMRARGYIDTKVASISPRLTALRFARRNAE